MIGRRNGGVNDHIGNNNAHKVFFTVMITALKYLTNKNNYFFLLMKPRLLETRTFQRKIIIKDESKKAFIRVAMKT